MPGPVDLTPTNTQIVTSKAPQSSVTPSQVAAPYAEFSDALTKVAGGVDELAVRQAHDEALTAVTRDETGQLQVKDMPLLVGRAADEYQRVAHQSYIAQIDPEIQSKLTELRVKSKDNPGEFQALATNYVNTLKAQQRSPELQNAVGSMAERYATETLNGLRVRQSEKDMTTARTAMAASQTQAENELSALSLQGITADDKTPAGESFRARLDDWMKLQKQRTENPLYQYSPAQAQYDQTQFLGKLSANAVISQVKKVYQDNSIDPETKQAKGGYDAAEKFAETQILKNPALNLTDDQRWGMYHKATAEIRAQEAARRQDLAVARTAANDAMMAASRGVDIGPELQQQIEDNLKKSGGVAEQAKFSAAILRARQLDSFNTLPLSQMPGVISWFASGAGAKASPEVQTAINEAAKVVGVSPAYMFRKASKESGFDPNAKGEGTTAGGLFQFTDATWADQLARNGGKYGLAPNTPKTDIRANALMAAELTKENAAGLKAAGIPATEANLSVAHFAGVEGSKKLYAADKASPAATVLPDAAAAPGNRSVFYDEAGQPRTVADALKRLYSGFGGPEGKVVAETGADPRMVASMQQAASKRAWAAWDVVSKDIDKGIKPADGVITPIIDAAKIAGDHDLLETIGARMERFGAVANVAQQPLTVQNTVVTGLQGAAAEGNLSPGKAALLGDLVTREKQIREGLAENPIATTMNAFPGRFNQLGPIDFSSEGSLAGDLAARAAISQFASHNYGGAAPLSLPVLDQQDVRDLQGAMATPAGGQVLLTMARALKPEELAKTFENKDLAGTLVGMQSSSTSPEKMSAANQIADKLWRMNPAIAESVLGPTAINKLHSWQGIKDTFSPEEIAQNLNAPRDPGALRVREELRKAALSATSSVKAADVAYQLGAGSWLLGGKTPLSVSPQYASTGQKVDYRYLPDSIAGGVLMDDYRQTSAALQADGIDASKADELTIKRLQSTWGPSAAGGGLLMKFPPEAVLPSINGSHDWVADQLNKRIAEQVGPQFSASAETGGEAAQQWTLGGLISDSRTETEYRKGSPSYQVAIKRADGRLAILPNRVSFDPSPYIAEFEKNLQGQVKNIQIDRWAHGGDRGDFLNLSRRFQATDRPSYLFGEASPE